MQDCLSGDVEQLCGVFLRPAEAGVGGVGALGHYRGDVAARRDQLRQCPERPRKRAERPAHRRPDPQPRELGNVGHISVPPCFTGRVLLSLSSVEQRPAALRRSDRRDYCLRYRFSRRSGGEFPRQTRRRDVFHPGGFREGLFRLRRL